MNGDPIIIAEHFIIENLKIWGSFSLIILVLIAVIIWQHKIYSRQREIYRQVIDEEKSERKEWQATAFTLLREVNEKLYVSLQGVKDVIEFLKDSSNSRGP